MALAIDPNLGEALRSLRLARGLGLDETGRLSGASKASLYAWENGLRRPRGPALLRLLDALAADARTKTRLLHLADPQQGRVLLANSVLGPPVDIGSVLRVMRERRGLSQADLGRQIGASQAAISHWESGDNVPSAETIHAVGFALGATVEETVALASVQGGAPEGLPSDVDESISLIWNHRVPFPLREVTYLGWEAEAWRRAGWNSRWDSSLAAVLSVRANLLVRQERYEEIDAIAQRSIRLGTTFDVQFQVTASVAALADADRHLGRGHARAANLAGQLSALLPDSNNKAWMLRQRGMSLIRMGRVAEGVEWVARSSEMDIALAGDRTSSWSYHAATLCEAFLEAGEPKRAADFIGGRREKLFEPITYVSVEHANGRAVTDADMEYLRYWVATQPPSGPDSRRLFNAERRQAWLKGDRSAVEPSRPNLLANIPKDPAIESRLWAAVLREHRG
ncbi:XRE family transcriptional regulator [bacterium]|nr:MAG: XRE family transcriptional regulator [bacterium]